MLGGFSVGSAAHIQRRFLVTNLSRKKKRYSFVLSVFFSVPLLFVCCCCFFLVTLCGFTSSVSFACSAVLVQAR